MHSGYYDRQSKLGDTAKYNYTNNYKYTGSSSIRASSQIRPVKSTNYGLVEPPSLNIYKSSTLGGASYLKSSYLPQVEPGKPKGLTNLRNTCYINSVLQILFDLL
jgi:ubiquitin C-terminal hydrolase